MFYTVESTVTFAIYSELSLRKLNGPSRLVLHLSGSCSCAICCKGCSFSLKHLVEGSSRELICLYTLNQRPDLSSSGKGVRFN